MRLIDCFALIIVRCAYSIEPGFYFNELKSFQLAPCKLGHFCANGVMKKCPEGTFGSERYLKTSSCSGKCEVGFYW